MQKPLGCEYLHNVIKLQKVQNYIFEENHQKLHIAAAINMHEQGSRLRDNSNKAENLMIKLMDKSLKMIKLLEIYNQIEWTYANRQNIFYKDCVIFFYAFYSTSTYKYMSCTRKDTCKQRVKRKSGPGIVAIVLRCFAFDV